MYKITLKGIRDPLFVQSDDEGLKIKQIWTESKYDRTFKIALQGKFFEKAKIDMLEYVKTTPKDEKDPKKAVLKAETEAYRSYLSKKPEIKAKRLQMWQTAFKLLHKRDPHPDRVKALKKDLTQFFTDNPKRTYADLDLYQRHLVTRQHNAPITILHNAYIKLMAKVIESDIYYSQVIKTK